MRIAAALLLLVSCAAQQTANGSVAGDLRTAGLTLTGRGAVSQPFLGVEGRVYEVEGGELQLYTYASESAAQTDAAKISPSGDVEGTMVHWMAPPHFYRRGSTLAIYVGASTRTLEVLRQVLGPPFAERK